MPGEKDPLKEFYSLLTETKAVSGLPDSYEKFSETLKNPDKARQFYDLVSTSNIKGIPSDFDTFSIKLGLTETAPLKKKGEDFLENIRSVYRLPSTSSESPSESGEYNIETEVISPEFITLEQAQQKNQQEELAQTTVEALQTEPQNWQELLTQSEEKIKNVPTLQGYIELKQDQFAAAGQALDEYAPIALKEIETKYYDKATNDPSIAEQRKKIQAEVNAYMQQPHTPEEIETFKTQKNAELESFTSGIAARYQDQAQREYQTLMDNKTKELLTPKTNLIPENLKTGLDALFNSDAFKEYDSDKKTKVISAAVQELYKQMPDATEAQKALARDELYMRYLDNIYTNQDTGAPSPFAIKKTAEDMLADVNVQIENLQKLIDDRGSVAYTQTIGQEGAGEQLRPDIKAQYDNLRLTKRNLQDVIDLPENDGGLVDFWRGLNSGRVIDKLPIFGSLIELSALARTRDIAEKKDSGKPLSKSEELALQSVALNNAYQGQMETSSLFNIGKGVSENLGTIGEFALSGGSYTLVKESFEAVMKKVLKDRIESTIGKLLSKPIAALVGSLAQTVVNPQQYLKGFEERIQPNIQLAFSEKGDELTYQVDLSDKDFNEAFKDAFGSTWTEFVTERIGAAGGFVKNDLLNNPEWLKRLTLARFLEKNGISWNDAVETFRKNKLGWNGILPEMTEELINIPLQNLVTGDYENSILEGITDKDGNIDWKNLGETAGVVAVLGAPGTIISIAKGKDSTDFKINAVEGEKTYSLPNEIADKIAALTTQEEIQAFKDTLPEQGITEEVNKEQFNAVNTVLDAKEKELTIKTEDNATEISERTIEKSPTESNQPEYTGTESRQQEIREGEGSQRETTIPEADTGDQHKEGQGKEETQIEYNQIFKKATDLFYEIKKTEGSTKRRTLSEERRALLAQYPSIQYIDQKIPAIYKQLEAKNIITKTGDCP